MAHPTVCEVPPTGHSRSPGSGNPASPDDNPNKSRPTPRTPPTAPATPTAKEAAFLKFCQVHGHHQVAEEHRNLSNLGGGGSLHRWSGDHPTNNNNSFNSLDDNASKHSQASTGSSSRTFGTTAVGWWKANNNNGAETAARKVSVQVQRHPLGYHAQTLQYTQSDLMNVAMDDRTFQSLKNGLRKRGVITNNYLRENLHFYVQHMKQVEQKKRQQQQPKKQGGPRQDSNASRSQ